MLELPVGWTISGQVTDSGNGRPLTDTWVQLFDAFENYYGQFQTDAEGKYYFTGLPNDSYRIFVSGPPQGYEPELYSEIPCPDYNCIVSAGTPVNVTDGDQPNKNIALDYTGTRLFGTVTRTDNGDPVSSNFGYMGVNLFDDEGNQIGGTGTDAAGNFQLHLPDGTASYYLATDHDSNYHALINECWDNLKCADWFDPAGAGADLILVPDGTTVTKDFVLDSAVVISGTVTAADGGAPIANVQLDMQDDQGNYITSASTDANGNYKLIVDGLGDYLVFIPPYGVPAPYLPQVWPGIDCNFYTCDLQATGTLIPVGGTSATDKNFVLNSGFVISGLVTDFNADPVQDLAVCIHRTTGEFTGVCGGTNGSGFYQTNALPAGTDYVAYAIGEEFGLIRQMWDHQDCTGFCDFSLGSPITLGPGDALNTNFDLAASDPGTISGSVLNSFGDSPGGAVVLYDQDGNQFDQFWLDDNGNFETYPIPTGIYYARTKYTWNVIDDVWDGNEGYQCPNQLCNPLDHEQIRVVSGTETGGIHFVLDPIDSGGVISGHVEDDSNNDLVSLIVILYNRDGDYLSESRTDLNGNYNLGPRTDDTYYVRTYGATGGLQNELWDDIPCTLGCDDPSFLTSGSPVVVSGSDRNDIDFVLRVPDGNIITGTVSDADLGVPLAEVYLGLFDGDGNWLFADTYSDGAGNYSFTGLADGAYKVYTNGTPEGYNQLLYNGVSCPDWSCDFGTQGQTLNLSGNQTASGIDFGLTYTGTRIFGAVTRTVGGTPVGNGPGHMRVDLFDTAGNHQQSYWPNPAGQFQFFVDPGDYRLATENDPEIYGLLNEVWNNKACDNGCDPT
ncbi:collagen binding domain-containing protein, partial [Pseudomonadota bacterium]